MTSNALAVALGVVGAAVGYLDFQMLAQQSLYGLVLPGVAPGRTL